jgi:hypothetical protein
MEKNVFKNEMIQDSKVTVLPRFSCRFNIATAKTPARFSVNKDKLIPNCIKKSKEQEWLGQFRKGRIRLKEEHYGS